MRIKYLFMLFNVLLALTIGNKSILAAESVSDIEKSMSDTLDIWREGRYEQLFEQLAHRNKTSREAFVKKMSESTIRPSCCWQKMENFKILNQKNNAATVYVKIGLDGTPNAAGSVTREFKMTNQEGGWKMQLADVLSIAGVTAKKKSGVKRHHKITTYNY